MCKSSVYFNAPHFKLVSPQFVCSGDNTATPIQPIVPILAQFASMLSDWATTKSRMLSRPGHFDALSVLELNRSSNLSINNLKMMINPKQRFFKAWIYSFLSYSLGFVAYSNDLSLNKIKYFKRFYKKHILVIMFHATKIKGELRPSEAIYHKIHHKILRLLQKKTNSLRFIVLMKSEKNCLNCKSDDVSLYFIVFVQYIIFFGRKIAS